MLSYLLTGYGNFGHLSKWDSAHNCFCYFRLVRKVEKVVVVLGLVVGNTIIVGVQRTVKSLPSQLR